MRHGVRRLCINVIINSSRRKPEAEWRNIGTERKLKAAEMALQPSTSLSVRNSTTSLLKIEGLVRTLVPIERQQPSVRYLNSCHLLHCYFLFPVVFV